MRWPRPYARDALLLPSFLAGTEEDEAEEPLLQPEEEDEEVVARSARSAGARSTTVRDLMVNKGTRS